MNQSENFYIVVIVLTFFSFKFLQQYFSQRSVKKELKKAKEELERVRGDLEHFWNSTEYRDPFIIKEHHVPIKIMMVSDICSINYYSNLERDILLKKEVDRIRMKLTSEILKSNHIQIEFDDEENFLETFKGEFGERHMERFKIKASVVVSVPKGD